MAQLIEAGEIRLGQYNKKRDTWAINRVQPKKIKLKKLKTVWRHTSHNAGTHGAGLLAQLLGQGQAFSFPNITATRSIQGPLRVAFWGINDSHSELISRLSERAGRAAI